MNCGKVTQWNKYYIAVKVNKLVFHIIMNSFYKNNKTKKPLTKNNEQEKQINDGYMQ